MIGVDCSPEEIQIYTALFKEYRGIFAWTYEEMPGIDPWIVEHENQDLSECQTNKTKSKGC